MPRHIVCLMWTFPLFLKKGWNSAGAKICLFSFYLYQFLGEPFRIGIRLGWQEKWPSLTCERQRLNPGNQECQPFLVGKQGSTRRKHSSSDLYETHLVALVSGKLVDKFHVHFRALISIASPWMLWTVPNWHELLPLVVSLLLLVGRFLSPCCHVS